MKDFLLYLLLSPRRPTLWLLAALVWALVYLHGLPFWPTAICAAVANVLADAWLYREDA